jgi:hypothetical protein
MPAVGQGACKHGAARKKETARAHVARKLGEHDMRCACRTGAGGARVRGSRPCPNKVRTRTAHIGFAHRFETSRPDSISRLAIGAPCIAFELAASIVNPSDKTFCSFFAAASIAP